MRFWGLFQHTDSTCSTYLCSFQPEGKSVVSLSPSHHDPGWDWAVLVVHWWRMWKGAGALWSWLHGHYLLSFLFLHWQKKTQPTIHGFHWYYPKGSSEHHCAHSHLIALQRMFCVTIGLWAGMCRWTHFFKYTVDDVGDFIMWVGGLLMTSHEVDQTIFIPVYWLNMRHVRQLLQFWFFYFYVNFRLIFSNFVVKYYFLLLICFFYVAIYD